MNIIDNAKAVDWGNLKITNDSGNTQWSSILDAGLQKAFLVAGILAFIYLVYSGFIYITAAGNPDATKKGQQGILNAIIGLVIVFLSYGIVFAVVSFLNSRG